MTRLVLQRGAGRDRISRASKTAYKENGADFVAKVNPSSLDTTEVSMLIISTSTIVSQSVELSTMSYDICDNSLILPQVIVSDDGNQQLTQSTEAFTRSLPHGYVARWEKTNEYDFDGDVTIHATRMIHLHKGTHKRLSRPAACGSELSGHWMSKKHRALENYADDPRAGVDYRVCPECWAAVNGGAK